MPLYLKSVCVCVIHHMHASGSRAPEGARSSGAQVTGGYKVVKCPTRMLGTKPRFSLRAESPFNCGTISSAHDSLHMFWILLCACFTHFPISICAMSFDDGFERLTF